MTYNEKLNRVHQLTGYSDPVYCESVVYMKDFDIVLSCFSVSTVDHGDHRDQSHESHDDRPRGGAFRHGIVQHHRQARPDHAGRRRNSTETGYIFGSITFSYSSSAEHAVVNLNEVYVSLMEYIKPADW